MSCYLQTINDECMIITISYLRAIDIAMLSFACIGDKNIMNIKRVSRGISLQLECTYMKLSSAYICQQIQQSMISKFVYRSEFLYFIEVKSILNSLSSPQATNGYWISTSWVSNAKKYYESLIIPDINLDSNSKKQNGSSKKMQKIRIRRGSDALPPWPNMNAEIVCSHGNLSLSKGIQSKGKRKLIDKKSWKLLRLFYPLGIEFKGSTSSECGECLLLNSVSKMIENENKEDVSFRFDKISPNMISILQRKNGVPSNFLVKNIYGSLTYSDVDLSITYSDRLEGFTDLYAEQEQFKEFEMFDNETWSIVSENVSSTASSPVMLYSDTIVANEMPVIPGLYIMVPRNWLKSWRSYIKDPLSNNLLPIDCTCLLCPTHKQLMIPPHLNEFLNGRRKYLLGRLGNYSGIIVELLSIEEWEELISSLGGVLSDFSVGFSYDGESIEWSMNVCKSCDPMDYLYINTLRKKNSTTNQCNKQTPSKFSNFKYGLQSDYLDV